MRTASILFLTLLAYGYALADSDQNSDWNKAAEEAVMSMDHEALRHALRQGADPNGKAGMWSSLLRAAVSIPGLADDEKAFAEEKNTDEIVRILVEHGAHVDPEDPSHDSALFLASMNDLSSIVKILLEAGAEPDWRPDKEHPSPTPLWMASLWGYPEAVQLLVEHGADPTITHRSTGSMGRPDTFTTPLEIAEEEGHHEVATILKRAME